MNHMLTNSTAIAATESSATHSPAALPIDMCSVGQVCEVLAIGEDTLLDLVNTGRLPAYDLGGHLRFKAIEVAAIAHELLAA